MTVSDAKDLLKNGGQIRCSTLVKVLTDLGFVVDGRRSGHKVYDHHAIQDFHGSNFDCGHGKNPHVKKCYIRNVLKIINAHERDLKKYLGEPDEL